MDKYGVGRCRDDADYAVGDVMIGEPTGQTPLLDRMIADENKGDWRHEFADQRICANIAKGDFAWFKRTQRRFWLLSHLWRKGPIYVNDCFDHSDPVGWLDVNIYLPSWRGLQCRWVFTVLPKSALLNGEPPNVSTIVWWHLRTQGKKAPNVLHEEGLKFWEWLNENIDTVLERPIIEYDNIYTSQDSFTKDDVVGWAKVWFSKWYPDLCGRDVVWKDME